MTVGLIETGISEDQRGQGKRSDVCERQIREIMWDSAFEEPVSEEKRAWRAFKFEYMKLRVAGWKTEWLLSTYNVTGCKMSLKISFLYSHLDFCQENCALLVFSTRSAFTKKNRRRVVVSGEGNPSEMLEHGYAAQLQGRGGAQAGVTRSYTVGSFSALMSLS